MLYTIKAIATGKSKTPYTWAMTSLCDEATSSAEKATMAILAPARIMDKCIHAKKVRSLAKKTLGSILMGALRSLMRVPKSP